MVLASFHELMVWSFLQELMGSFLGATQDGVASSVSEVTKLEINSSFFGVFSLFQGSPSAGYTILVFC